MYVDVTSFYVVHTPTLYEWLFILLWWSGSASHQCDPGSIPGVVCGRSDRHLPDHVGFLRVLRFPPTQTTPLRHHPSQRGRFIISWN